MSYFKMKESFFCPLMTLHKNIPAKEKAGSSLASQLVKTPYQNFIQLSDIEPHLTLNKITAQSIGALDNVQNASTICFNSLHQVI